MFWITGLIITGSIISVSMGLFVYWAARALLIMPHRNRKSMMCWIRIFGGAAAFGSPCGCCSIRRHDS